MESGPTVGKSADRLPARARVLAYGMVATLLVAGLAQIEFWPVTSFRLFSTVRSPTQTRWELAVVSAGDHDESLVDVGRLTPILKGAEHILPDLVGADPAVAARTVRPWLEAAGHPFGSVAEVRVYSVVLRLGDDGRRPLVVVSRTLRAEFPA